MIKQPKQTDPIPCQAEQAYGVTINTAAFLFKHAPVKQRAQRELLPQYWQKFKMDQKTILPSKEDRLSQLTTKQIDRIIDMQKIRSLLYNKKRKLNDHYINFQQKNPNVHSNIYQANFLATVNQIAIQRNIRHQASEGFDEFDQALPNQNKASKRIITVPYKYTKNYTRRSRPGSKNHYSAPEQEQEKSIDSIEVDLDAFQLNLQQKKMSTINSCERKQRNGQSKLLNTRRWFYGMSTFYIDKANKNETSQQIELYRGDYDIESQMKDASKDLKKTSVYRRTSISLFSNQKAKQSSKSKREAFDKFKTSRLVTLG